MRKHAINHFLHFIRRVGSGTAIDNSTVQRSPHDRHCHNNEKGGQARIYIPNSKILSAALLLLDNIQESRDRGPHIESRGELTRPGEQSHQLIKMRGGRVDVNGIKVIGDGINVNANGSVM